MHDRQFDFELEREPGDVTDDEVVEVEALHEVRGAAGAGLAASDGAELAPAAADEVFADDLDDDLDGGDLDEREESEESAGEELELAPAGSDGAEPASAPPAVSRKVRRRSRRTRPRSKTIAMKRLTREELRLGALLNPPVDVPRPNIRAECANEIRPCPWVACKHHLYLDVNPETGSIKINFPDLEPWEMRETCALDVADRSGITLEEVGEIMNLTRERIRQVEVRGLLKLKMASALEAFTGVDVDIERERDGGSN